MQMMKSIHMYMLCNIMLTHMLWIVFVYILWQKISLYVTCEKPAFSAWFTCLFYFWSVYSKKITNWFITETSRYLNEDKQTYFKLSVQLSHTEKKSLKNDQKTIFLRTEFLKKKHLSSFALYYKNPRIVSLLSVTFVISNLMST